MFVKIAVLLILIIVMTILTAWVDKATAKMDSKKRKLIRGASFVASIAFWAAFAGFFVKW